MSYFYNGKVLVSVGLLLSMSILSCASFIKTRVFVSMAIGQTKETQLIANDSYVDIETKAKLSFKLPVHLGQSIKITNENELIQQIPNEINHIQWEEKKKLNYNKFTGNTLKHLVH